MFISVIFNTEYMEVSERIKWFLKNLSHGKENSWLIITHEYLGKHFDQLIKSCGDRFYTEFEMDYIDRMEMERQDVYYVPDSVFDNLHKRHGSQTKMLLELEKNRSEELEYHIEKAIQNSLTRRNETVVEGIFNMLHSFESLRYIADKYQCRLIPYTFTAVRKVHGYQKTLYMANMDGRMFDSLEAKKRYAKFKNEEINFNWFSNKEILALLGKERNIPLLGVINMDPIYEVGVAVEAYDITPQSYEKNHITDDDIYYACKRLYSENQITTRVHPMKYDRFGIGREHFKNDPAPFLLSCKRIASVQSQLIVKAIMWGRVPCVQSNTLPFAFLCESDYRSEKRMEEKDMNFLFFSYFIPSKCMFDMDYWRWRLKNPSEKEIFLKHLNILFSELGIPEDIIYLKSDQERLKEILKFRGWDHDLAPNVLNHTDSPKLNYNYLLSKLEVCYTGLKDGDKRSKAYYCLNTVENERLVSRFTIQLNNDISNFKFYPVDDVSGIVCLSEIICDAAEMNQGNLRIGEYTYIRKNTCAFYLSVKKIKDEKITITFVWKACRLEEYLMVK